MKSLFEYLANSQEIPEDLSRLQNICLRAKRINDFVLYLMGKEKIFVILELFSQVKVGDFVDYEDTLFNLADTICKSNQVDHLVKMMEVAVIYANYQTYPLFSLCLRKLVKTNRVQESLNLVRNMMSFQVEISTCAINFLLETLCKHDMIDEAQTLFDTLIFFEPRYTFPEIGYTFQKLILSSGISIITYGTYIKSLCKSGHMELAIYHYENLRDSGKLKDEVVFNLLIDGCSKSSNLAQLKRVYNDMIDLKIAPTIVTFNTIIDAYVRAKDINYAWKIYDDILKFEIKPDNYTFSTIFRGVRNLNQAKDLIRSFEILEELKKKEDHIDIIIINVLLDSCIAMREPTLTQELFEKVKSGSFFPVRPDIVTFNTFIKGCAQMNLFGKAYEAFEFMLSERKDVMPNDVTFNSIIDVCVRGKDMSKVWSIIDKMKQCGIKPDNFTYSTIIKGINKHPSSNSNTTSTLDEEDEAQMDLAFKLFENVRKFNTPDEIMFNCLMDACLRFNKFEKMFELYEEMQTLKIKPSSITCGIVIKAYGMTGNLKKALCIYSDMKRDHIEISSITYGCLINACIKNENLNQAFVLYEELSSSKVEMNTVLYTTMIKAYAKSKNIQKVMEVFNRMKQDKSNTPNNVTFNSVIDCFIKCEEVSLAEKIFEDMKASGVKPDIITFSTLVKGCLKANDLNKSLDYLYSMNKFDVKPDYVLLNSFLDGCEKMKKYNKAVEIFKYIRSFNVEPSMMAFSIMMKVNGRLHNFEDSKALMEEVKRKKGNISLIIFTCYIRTCFSTHHVEEAMSTFKSLQSFNLSPDTITYTTMLNGLIAKKSANYIMEILENSLVHKIRLPDSYYEEIISVVQKKKGGQGEQVTKLLEENGIFIGQQELNSTPDQKEVGNYLIDGYKHKINKNKYDNRERKYSQKEQYANNSQTGNTNLQEKGAYFKNFNNYNNFTNLNTPISTTSSSTFKPTITTDEPLEYVLVKQQPTPTNEKFKRGNYTNNGKVSQNQFTPKIQSFAVPTNSNSELNGKENKTVKKINRF